MSEMRKPKRRVQVMLDPDLHDTLKGFAAIMPGASVSGLINDSMMPMVPHLEKLRLVVLEGDEERALTAINEMVGSLMMAAIHTPREKTGETEASG